MLVSLGVALEEKSYCIIKEEDHGILFISVITNLEKWVINNCFDIYQWHVDKTLTHCFTSSLVL